MTWFTQMSLTTRIASIAALIIAGIWSFVEYRASAEQVELASADLAECQRLSADIKQMKSLPTFAALEADSPRRTAERIESAVDQAALPETALVRIQPQSPYRIGNSTYRIWPTRLELKQVTLAQITAFAHALSHADEGLAVRDLRVWYPGREDDKGPEIWSAEITLTQLAFSPKTR